MNMALSFLEFSRDFMPRYLACRQSANFIATACFHDILDELMHRIELTQSISLYDFIIYFLSFFIFIKK
jgi:hypothetical protein